MHSNAAAGGSGSSESSGRFGYWSLPFRTIRAMLWASLGMAGIYAITDTASTWVLVLCWLVYALVLLGQLMGMTMSEKGCSVAGWTVALAAFAVIVVRGEMEPLLVLMERGREADVVVEDEFETRSGKSKTHFYVLEHTDGSEVPGGNMRVDSDEFNVGDRIVVLEDPKGIERPLTPGLADPTPERWTIIGIGVAVPLLVLYAGIQAHRKWRREAEETTGSKDEQGDEGAKGAEESKGADSTEAGSS